MSIFFFGLSFSLCVPQFFKVKAGNDVLALVYCTVFTTKVSRNLNVQWGMRRLTVLNTDINVC